MASIIEMIIVIILGIGTITISAYACLLMRKIEKYTFLKINVILHIFVGSLFWVDTLIYFISYTLYIQTWYITLIASIIMVIDILIFTRGNLLESIKKFKLTSIILVPLLIKVAEVMMSPGILIATFFAGMIIGLMLELIYASFKAYSLTKGGKLFELWKRMLILAVLYVAMGLSFSILGIFVMLRYIEVTLGAMIILLVHLFKSIGFVLVVNYYNKNIKPLIKKMALL